MRGGRVAEALGLAVGLLGLMALARARGLPGVIGWLRDDGEYAAFALALLAGDGYVNPSEPGLPVASRYPPGFPALLAMLLAGAPAGAGQVARLDLVPPVLLALFAAAAYLYLRKAGWGIAAAGVATGAIAAAPEALRVGTTLHSDPPFAVLVLGLLLAADAAWRRTAGPGPWALIGAAVGAACLLRYAGAALLVALLAGLGLGRRWAALAAAAGGFAAAFGPWVVFRWLRGGENYVGTSAVLMPADLADWPGRFGLAALHVGGRAVPGVLLPPLATTASPAAWVLGLALSFVVALGAWRWLRDREAPPFAPLFVAATVPLVIVAHAGFVHYMPTLASRLVLPIAPLIWLLAAGGAAALLRDAPIPRPVAARGALAIAVLALLGATWQHPPPPDLATEAGRQQAAFAAVRREVPPDARVLTQFPAMVWLHTGRRGYAIPYVGTGGTLGTVEPLAFLMTLEHWRITHVVLTPGAVPAMAAAVPAFQAAFPGVLVPRGAGGGVWAIAPGPYEAALKAHDVRARNAAFEDLP